MELLIKIERGFKEMIKTGKVNLSILNPLREFKTNLFKFKKNIISSERNIYDRFPIFHAIETQIRIIDQMIYRINRAPEIHDNPRVAEDALVVMLPFKSLQNSLLSGMIYDNPHYIMSLSSNLQIIAMKNEMYPSSEQITELIDKEILKDNFGSFVGNVGEEIERI